MKLKGENKTLSNEVIASSFPRDYVHCWLCKQDVTDHRPVLTLSQLWVERLRWQKKEEACLGWAVQITA